MFEEPSLVNNLKGLKNKKLIESRYLIRINV